MAITRSQATANAQRIKAGRQDPESHSSIYTQRSGVGLTAAEVAREAEAETVRIQEYAAKMTAQNNPPRPHEGLRKEMIAKIKAATNRRLDAQAYAARMAREAEATRAAREAEAARVVAQIDRVQEDVDRTAPQMAEATQETIAAARILMQLKLEQIASVERTIQEISNLAAEHDAAQQLVVVNQAAQQAVQNQAVVNQAAQQAAQHRALVNQAAQQAAQYRAGAHHAAQQAAQNLAAQRQAASEAERAATRLLYMRHGFDLRFEQERRDRESARNAQSPWNG